MFSQILKSRTLWGAVLMAISPEIGGAVNGLVNAIDSHSAAAIAQAIGGALVVVGRLYAKPILAK